VAKVFLVEVVLAWGFDIMENRLFGIFFGIQEDTGFDEAGRDF